jgi:glycosyltransferase involved in cell wall biosynthesis
MDCSIVIPVRNGSDFLESLFVSLDSISAHKVPIIIVEDHSTDNSFEFLAEYAIQNPNISLVRNPGSGLSDALNHGFSLCRTKWIARMDVDDVYDSRRIQIQLQAARDDVAVIFSDYKIFKDGAAYAYPIPTAVNPHATIASLVNNHRTPHPVAIINKEKFLLAGGYHSKSFPVEDLDLWFRISRFGKIIGVPILLLRYRRHGSSVTAQMRTKVRVKHWECINKPTNLNLVQNSLDKLDIRECLMEYKNYDFRNMRIGFLFLDLFYAEKLLTKGKGFLPLLKLLSRCAISPRALLGIIRIFYFYIRLKII